MHGGDASRKAIRTASNKMYHRGERIRPKKKPADRPTACNSLNAAKAPSFLRKKTFRKIEYRPVFRQESPMPKKNADTKDSPKRVESSSSSAAPNAVCNIPQGSQQQGGGKAHTHKSQCTYSTNIRGSSQRQIYVHKVSDRIVEVHPLSHPKNSTKEQQHDARRSSRHHTCNISRGQGRSTDRKTTRPKPESIKHNG